ncbi:hypothetical protein SDC9_92954 [bioreactor metagenome]|uniref:Uncharacterized protein n=1 Tax=bioreactor metagenome TaxID=1076179 RepID=A0A645A021_9ZZZZ
MIKQGVKLFDLKRRHMIFGFTRVERGDGIHHVFVGDVEILRHLVYSVFDHCHKAAPLSLIASASPLSDTATAEQGAEPIAAPSSCIVSPVWISAA